MKYIEEAIDTNSEYGKKYLALVSRNDTGSNLETHHIVPVAYFADVLGYKECRLSSSPDMVSENLVSLTRGHHVLAHFYLAKCARKCISIQMINAFCLTFQTTDFSSITEEDVLSRIDEIDIEYRKMKSMKKRHKDGIEERHTRNLTSMTTWKNGEKCGPHISMRPDGTIISMGMNGKNEVHWKFGYIEWNTIPKPKPKLTYFVVETEHFFFQVNFEVYCAGETKQTLLWCLGTLPNYANICNNYQPGCYQEIFSSNYVKDFKKAGKQIIDILTITPSILSTMGFSSFGDVVSSDPILHHIIQTLGSETVDSRSCGVVSSDDFKEAA